MRFSVLLAMVFAAIVGTAVTAVTAAQVYHMTNPVTIVQPQPFWSATGDQDSSTDTSIKALATGVRHCVTGVQVSTKATLGSAQVFRILSADTVLWTLSLNTAGLEQFGIVFPTPICTAFSEALEVDTDADPTDNLIFYNLQGYSASQ
jgi:hypothetical protein